MDYRRIKTSYEDYIHHRKTYHNTIKELTPLAKFIYMYIFNRDGEDNAYGLEEIEHIRHLSLKDIYFSRDGMSIEFVYEYKYLNLIEHEEYIIEMGRKEYDEYEEKVRIQQEGEKYNL